MCETQQEDKALNVLQLSDLVFLKRQNALP